jgi:hypothetical protein
MHELFHTRKLMIFRSCASLLAGKFYAGSRGKLLGGGISASGFSGPLTAANNENGGHSGPPFGAKWVFERD